MVIRHILLAGLVAGASMAQAAPTNAHTGAVVAGWTLEKGSVDVVGAVDYMQVMLAKANEQASSWDLQASMDGTSGNSAKLFTLNRSGNAAAPRLSFDNAPTQMLLPAGVPLFAQQTQSGQSADVGQGGRSGASTGASTGASRGPFADAVKAGSNGVVQASANASDNAHQHAAPNSAVQGGGNATSEEIAAGGTNGTIELIKAGNGDPLVLAADLDVDAAATAVPEPSSNMLMLAGLLAGAVMVRRRVK